MGLLAKFDGLMSRLGRKIVYTNWAGAIYTVRYYLIFSPKKYKWMNIVLHHFPNTSQDRWMHDHARWCISICFAGGYTEHRLSGETYIRKPGSIYVIGPDTQHRVSDIKPGTMTLFMVGYKYRPSRYFDTETGKLVNYDVMPQKRLAALERLKRKTIRGL